MSTGKRWPTWKVLGVLGGMIVGLATIWQAIIAGADSPSIRSFFWPTAEDVSSGGAPPEKIARADVEPIEERPAISAGTGSGSPATVQARPAEPSTAAPGQEDAQPPAANRPPLQPAEPPIGIAGIICASRSIFVRAEISDDYVQSFREMSGTTAIAVGDCDPRSGAFTVVPAEAARARPTRGLAHEYSLSFEYVVRSEPNVDSLNTTCRIGASMITNRMFRGVMRCTYSHYTAEWPVEITI
jgi:hypothetical protein